MKVIAKNLTNLLGRTLMVLSLAGCLSSCELVRDDLAECPVPVQEVRFVYDYNMEFANAFHNQFDCLSAYFFDSEGKLVAVEKVTERAILSDENYRMHPDLPAGKYRVIAYGGMDCEKTSFYQVNNLELGSHYSDIHVQLDRLVTVSDIPAEDREKYRRLHNQFYGAADFTVEEELDTYVTVKMMRNTNSIQIALQNEFGDPIDYRDFTFEITDDNNDFDCDNNLLPTGEIIYRPWNTENRTVGLAGRADTDEDTDEEVQPREFHAALAQFVTSRLVKPTARNGKRTSTMLHIRRVEDGKTVLQVPLVNYMLMFKNDNTGAGLDYMDDQEFLDRENSWNFVFFLKDRLWVDTHIVINDWEVRLNSADF